VKGTEDLGNCKTQRMGNTDPRFLQKKKKDVFFAKSSGKKEEWYGLDGLIPSFFNIELLII